MRAVAVKAAAGSFCSSRCVADQSDPSCGTADRRRKPGRAESDAHAGDGLPCHCQSRPSPGPSNASAGSAGGGEGGPGTRGRAHSSTGSPRPSPSRSSPMTGQSFRQVIGWRWTTRPYGPLVLEVEEPVLARRRVHPRALVRPVHRASRPAPARSRPRTARSTSRERSTRLPAGLRRRRPARRCSTSRRACRTSAPRGWDGRDRAPSTTFVPSPSTRRPSGLIRCTVRLSLNPARLFAQACTRYSEPSSSHSGQGSIRPLPACTSVRRLPGPARVAGARSGRCPRSGSPT